MAFDEVFLTADWLVGNESLGHQEPVGRNTQAGMVVKTSPTAPLVVAQPEVLLQILVVALDPPSLVGGADQLVQRRVFR